MEDISDNKYKLHISVIKYNIHMPLIRSLDEIR